MPERRKERVSERVLFFIEKKADKKRVPALSRCLHLQYDVQRRFANGKNTRTLLRLYGLYSTGLSVPKQRKERVSEWVLFFIGEKRTRIEFRHFPVTHPKKPVGLFGDPDLASEERA